LTFDDGFVDNFESAFPSLLAALATFFITIGFVDRTPDAGAHDPALANPRRRDHAA
jgi:peptidoglycan/xylan/chitin deacetylase (PgdA/CDA1 family)